MMQRGIGIVIAAALWSGCLYDGDIGGDMDDMGTSIAPLYSENQLSLNQLSLNQLSLNQLSSDVLIATGQGDHTWTLDQQTSGGIQNTADGRTALQYIARCALAGGDVLAVVDLQGTTYAFPGLLGLAPGWKLAPLDDRARALVSACLIAHVNAYGVQVAISVRAANQLTASASEMSAYSVYEGTFFGTVFAAAGSSMKLYACQGDRSALARAQSTARQQRACTDTTADCAVTVVGLCRDVCSLYSDDHGWQDCQVAQPDGSIDHYMDTVSVYLWADNPNGANRACGAGQSCAFSTLPNQIAVFDSAASSTSTLTCAHRGQCIIHAAEASAVSLIAGTESVAQLDCMGADSCAASCSNGATCDIDCTVAGTCSAIQCTGGSHCLLECADAGSCGFSSCPGGAITCPDDTIVCGRACP